MSALEKAKKYGMIAFLIFLVLVLAGLVSLAGYLGYNLYQQHKTKNVSGADQDLVSTGATVVNNDAGDVLTVADADSKVSTIAPMYDFVSSRESISADITTYAKKAKDENKLFFVVVCGKHDSNDKSWCPDCQNAEPIINKLFHNLDEDVVVMLAPVPRGYKAPIKQRKKNHPYHDHFAELEGVPTVYRMDVTGMQMGVGQSLNGCNRYRKPKTTLGELKQWLKVQNVDLGSEE
eukprot:4629_1